MEYIKKVDLLAAAVEVEYLGRPRMMVSVATIGKMPSIEAVPLEYHNKVCEEMARRHQAEILELTADRPQGEWTEREVFRSDDNDTSNPIIDDWQSAKCSVCGKYHTTPYLYYFDNFNYCPNCGARMKGADDE